MKKRIFGNGDPEVAALGLSCMSLSYGGLRKKDHHLADLFLGAKLSRRTALGASALLLLGAALPGSAKGDIMNRSTSLNTLVVYFSRSGNTRVIAGTIQRALTADILEIKPAAPYPEDYNATVEQARIERDQGLEPLLAGKVENMGQYETIYLGFPIWGETTPPVIRSFLRTNNLQGKTVRPFITHGGYGLGRSLSVLASHAPGAHIEPEFSMEADQEKQTLAQVSGWLKRVEAR